MNWNANGFANLKIIQYYSCFRITFYNILLIFYIKDNNNKKISINSISIQSLKFQFELFVLNLKKKALYFLFRILFQFRAQVLQLFLLSIDYIIIKQFKTRYNHQHAIIIHIQWENPLVLGSMLCVGEWLASPIDNLSTVTIA
jgi:hypothetical protein